MYSPGMQTTQHTPKPWVVRAAQDTHGFHNYTINGRGNPDEREANARLIAVAPDLLEALKRIMHYARMGAQACDVNVSEQPEFIKAVTAISKAEGK